jgi:hypothetical protein
VRVRRTHEAARRELMGVLVILIVASHLAIVNGHGAAVPLKRAYNKFWPLT